MQDSIALPRSARIVASLLLLATAVPAAFLAAEDTQPTVRIGMVVDGPWSGNDFVRELTVREVTALTAGELEVRFPPESYRIADWTLDGTRAAIDALLADPEVDLVIAWGVLASHALCCYQALPKPVIAPVILDRRLQDLPLAEDGGSGRRNLNYVALPDNTRRELVRFREIVPFEHLALLGNAAIFEAIPELALRVRRTVGDLGFTVDLVPVGRDVEAALAAIGERVDAALVWPLLHLSDEQLARLVAGLNARRVATYSALGGRDLEAGMLATLTTDQLFPRLARRVALNVQRILLGEDAGTIPVAFPARERLTINMATARAIGVSPRWRTLVEAELLHPEDEAPGLERLSLGQTVQRAIAANLDLMAEGRALAAGAQEVARARAARRPQLDASASTVVIDDDRAAASFGAQAERSLRGGLELTQLVYADAANADVAIQERLQQARESGYQTVRLDVAFEAAVTYLDLLRAKTLARVRRNNLRLTRSNLDLARVRRSIGAANPAEVYRWESEIANDRQSLIAARAVVETAEIAVNRLLDRDLETAFATVEVDLEDPGLITGHDRFRGFIETPRVFRTLREFIVARGLEAAPELTRLDRAIAAQERALLAARRAFRLPVVSAGITLDTLLAEAGAGSGGGFAGMLGVPEADDVDWSVALVARLPLLTGGARAAERIQVEETLAQLRLEREAAAQRVEQRIRSAMIAARASFSGIDLSREAAAAAAANLDLVADAYARGAIGVIDLLDAQNAAIAAELAAANAVYDFLIDLMEAQRAANRFDFFISPDARDRFLDLLEAYFAAQDVEPWREP